MDFNRFDKYGSYKSVKIANMTFILRGNGFRTLIIKSYDTEIMRISFSNNFSMIADYSFNTRSYSATTTRHQGIAAYIYIDLIYNHYKAVDRENVITSLFEKKALKDFNYMSVAERKEWSLI